MSKVENAVRIAEAVAADDSIGYQWGGWGPEYDCGHLIIDAFERAGIPVKSRGASYTGNMPAVFMACGAANVTDQVNLDTGAGMKRGDVLVNLQNHAALYVGGGRIVQARSNFDGVPGDSSGQEIRVQGYYNYPWTHVLRFQDEALPAGGTDTPAPIETPQTAPSVPRNMRKGMVGSDVREMQELLIRAGFDVGPDGADGEVGKNTLAAVIRFQESAHLEQDGIAGPLTMAALRNATPAPESAKTQEDAQPEPENAQDREKMPAETAKMPETPEKYTVKKGDTLWAIARDVLGDWSLFEVIKSINGLISSWIYPGQVLKLPRKKK